MAQLDALRVADVLRERLVDFAADDGFVRDPHLAAICRRLWSGSPEQGGLLSDLWVEGNFPAEQAEASLDDLVKADHFPDALASHLDTEAAVPRRRKLYSHQHEALRYAGVRDGERPAMVVTAGTGAGKTEAFLLPALRDLWQDDPGERNGVRCIVLYPMNALVNDQMDRLYGWLRGQRRITLFHFTSETPEDRRGADREGIPRWDPCRFRTRQQARGLETAEGERLEAAERGPIPDILITNYSMLEYMLCRPQDAVFFGPALRTIVLDEAHLYTGTLAAEITLLLRRLYSRSGVRPEEVLQIATSATLGSGSDTELRQFASTLFSKDEAAVHVIQGRPARLQLGDPAPPERVPGADALAGEPWLTGPLLTADREGTTSLSIDPGLCTRLRERLPRLVGAPAIQAVDSREDRPAVLLYETLRKAPLLHTLERILWDRRHLPLSELAEALWQDASKPSVLATIELLKLAASAREQPAHYPLIPHRIHLLARPSTGLSVCLRSDCPGEPGSRLEPLGTVVAGIRDLCPTCSGAVLALHRCDNCGEWLLAGELSGSRLQPVLWPNSHTQRFILAEGDGNCITVDPMSGEISGAGGAGLRVRQVKTCPHCDADADRLKPFASGTPLPLAILAETALMELPEYPASHNPWLPARGRRLLAFSDSRQEAARLGPRLTRQHEAQVARAAMVECIEQSLAADDATIADLQADIQDFEERLQSPGLTPAQRQRYERRLAESRQELAGYEAGGSLSEWAAALAGHTLLAEILDAETGQRHQVGSWGQREWDRNRARVKEKAEAFLGLEFARRAGPTETAGLAEVTYPGTDRLQAPDAYVGLLPAEGVRQCLRSCWPDFQAELCDTLRSDGAVTLGSDQEDLAYPQGEILLGRWCTDDPGRDTRLVRFVGATPRQRRRRFAQAVLEACGMEEPQAETGAAELLQVAFRQLLAHAVPEGERAGDDHLLWLERTQRQRRDGPPAEALRLRFQHLGLRRPAQLFRCERTGHVWYRSVLGCAPEAGCKSTLHPVTAEALDGDPRVGRSRREFREAAVFRQGLWAEEHSAQLASQENRRLQDLFKAGIRNILSATTTLELGIDIGGLNAVLMSNVPPGKANYLQRAGRAGRRADGSSVVITYARPRPFDTEVFGRIGDYLNRPLRRPRVFLDRDRIVRRHFHSFLLGQFFRAIYPAGAHVGAMRAFGRMGSFSGVALPPHWPREERDKPPVPEPDAVEPDDGASLPWWNPALKAPGLEAQFLSYLYWTRDWGEYELRPEAERLFEGTDLAQAVDDWPGLLGSVAEGFVHAVEAWREDYDNLSLSWHVSDEKAQVNAIRYQLAALHDLTVIEALADRQFLPHYGFPIGLQKLRVIAPDAERPGKIREEDQYRLERSSLMALREYVPGSQMLVGGRLTSSRGLLKHWTGANLDTYLGLRGRFCRCTNGHLHYWLTGEAQGCPICGSQPAHPPGQLLFPKHGFSGAAWDPPRWSTEVERVGHAETATITFARPRPSDRRALDCPNFGQVLGLTARYRENGELLVYNPGEQDRGFAVCLKCGYADSETKQGQGVVDLPTGFLMHAPLTSPNRWAVCWRRGDGTALRNQVLAGRETTDVLMLDFTACLGPCAEHEPVITTLAYALQRSGASLLELDTRELGVLVVPSPSGGRGLGAVVYDSMAGGAGHVRELLALERDWLEMARQTLYVSEDHHATCRTACLHCLLSFDAQDIMARALFNRPLALAALDALLSGGPLPDCFTDAHWPPDPPAGADEGDPVSFLPRSPADRLNSAADRLRRKRR